MSTKEIERISHEIGYRRTILVVGALWGMVPATYGLVAGLLSISEVASLSMIVILFTIVLAVLFQLDSQMLANHGSGVPRAWTYALFAPILLVISSIFGPLLATLFGPPLSALLYLWRRGQVITAALQ
jgi:uncharacterized membrane protein YkgB